VNSTFTYKLDLTCISKATRFKFTRNNYRPSQGLLVVHPCGGGDGGIIKE